MNIVQFSDCHIGQSTENSERLAKVVTSIMAQSPDIIIATGDLTQHGTLSEYLEFVRITAPLDTLYVIAGNHDNITNMQKVFSPKQYTSFLYKEYYIQLVTSKVEDKISGYINPSDIVNHPNSLVFTHHPVLPMQSSWDDNISITNMDAVCSRMDEHILLVGFGHVHQAKEFSIGSTKVCACPSAAYGFETPSEWGYNLFTVHGAKVDVKTIVMQ